MKTIYFSAGFLFVLPAATQNIFTGLINKTLSEFEGLYAIQLEKK